MTKTQLKTLAVLLIPLFLFTSCDMASTRNSLNGLADGSKVPASLAIASGDIGIMIECLASLGNSLDNGGLSDVERGEIALDMIDLLAVLSGAVVAMVPYLIEGVPPTDLSKLEDFYESANIGTLARIAQESLMEIGVYADPSPMQLFWSLLSLILIQDTYPDVVYTDLDPGPEQDSYILIVNKAVQLSTEGTNKQFLPLLNYLRLIIGDPNL